MVCFANRVTPFVVSIFLLFFEENKYNQIKNEWCMCGMGVFKKCFFLNLEARWGHLLVKSCFHEHFSLQIFEWWYFKKYGTSFIEQVSLNHISPLLGGGDASSESTATSSINGAATTNGGTIISNGSVENGSRTSSQQSSLPGQSSSQCQLHFFSCSWGGPHFIHLHANYCFLGWSTILPSMFQ